MSRPPQRPHAVVMGPGVFLPAHLCLPVWRCLKAELDRHRQRGAQVRPEIAELLDALRAAAHGHLTAQLNAANGHADTPQADIGASSPQALISTADLAARLGVSERHARRLAALEGIAPASRGRWRIEDARLLEAARP